MDDLISRQAAIGAICTEGTRLERNGTVAMAEIKQWCVDILEALPSAQPERKTGVWLEDEDDPESVKTDGYCGYCSACKEWSEYLTAYCGNCGADMRGTWNETN